MIMEKRAATVGKRVMSILAIVLISAAVWGGVYFASGIFADYAAEVDAYQTVEARLKKDKKISEKYGKIVEVEPDGEDAVEVIHSRLSYVRCIVTNEAGEKYRIWVTYTLEDGKDVFSYSEAEAPPEGEEGEENDQQSDVWPGWQQLVVCC